MRLFRSVIEPGCRWLARHLHRLRRTLEGLYDRLREAIAVAVARAAEDAVREGVHALLMDKPPLCPPDYPHRNFTPSGWRDDEEDELGRWEECLDYEQGPRGRSEASAQVPSDEQTADPTAPGAGRGAAGGRLVAAPRRPLPAADGPGRRAGGPLGQLRWRALGRRRRRPGRLGSWPAVPGTGDARRLRGPLTTASARR